MTTNETQLADYKARYAIDDTLAILDSAPAKVDLHPDHMMVEITNRAAVAHLSIERGFKYLVKQAGGEVKRQHGLAPLLRRLTSCDRASADQLEASFNEAVQFFGYNPNTDGKGHLRSLDSYLSRTGSQEAFSHLRYWAIGEPEHDAMQALSLTLHREILYTLARILWRKPRTVSQRAEATIHGALISNRNLAWTEGDVGTEQSYRHYKEWLYSHRSGRHAMQDIVESRFNVGDEFANHIARQAYDELAASDDIAVRYFIRTLGYLPKGSQHRVADLAPCVELNANGTRGSIATPAGNPIAWLEKQHDDSWIVAPALPDSGLQPIFVQSLADAKNYITNSFTRKLLVMLGSAERQLYVVSTRDYLFPSSTAFVGDMPSDYVAEYDLEFWDSRHGLEVGDRVAMALELSRQHIITGTVVRVTGERVKIQHE